MDSTGNITTTGTFRFLTINDVYNIEPINNLGGYAEISTLVKKYRTKNSLFVLNGDFLGGTPTGQRFKGENVIKMLDCIGLDYAVLGNHEFDFGDAELKKRIAESKFKWFGTNVFEKHTQKIIQGAISTDVITIPFRQGFREEEVPPLSRRSSVSSSSSVPPSDASLQEEHPVEIIKIGLFGVCTQATPFLSFPTDNMDFRNILEETKKAVAKLRDEDKVDVIIGITHVSFEEDKKIASKVRGIYALLGGHDHVPFLHVEDNTWIFKTGQNAYHLGTMDLRFEINRSIAGGVSSDRHIRIFPSFGMIPNNGVEPDPKCKEVIDHYSSIIQKEAKEKGLDKVILTVSPLAIRDLETLTHIVRRKDSEFASYIADSMKSYFEELNFHCDLAIINGGYIRGDRSYSPGTKLSIYDLQQELPFPMQPSLITIKGSDLREAMEQQLRGAPKPVGSFPHPSKGCVLEFDPLGEPLDKIRKIEINGELLDPEKEYNVAITDFMQTGGDGCSSFTRGKRVHLGKDLFHIITEYFATLDPIEPHPSGRVVEVEAV